MISVLVVYIALLQVMYIVILYTVDGWLTEVIQILQCYVLAYKMETWQKMR